MQIGILQVSSESGKYPREDNQTAIILFRMKKKRNCTVHVEKRMALISFAVTAKLICAFVFTYADCLFSFAASQILIIFII